MAYLLRHATIFCLPTSYREGLPRVLVEASAAGRPIITTDTPGCRDVVKDGVNGTLVPPGNIPALVDALRKLLIDRDMCTRMGLAARQRFEKQFTLEAVLNALN
jgi:glycosyltransferase involved in cell wall biosynthesis